MDSPNSHPLPEYPSSDDDINFHGELSDNDSDITDSECEEEMESLWREFDEEKAELDEELEEEMWGQYTREAEEEAAHERLMKEMWEETDETEESDETEDDED